MDISSGKAMAQHTSALIQAQLSRQASSSADVLARIEDKVDATLALASAASASSASLSDVLPNKLTRSRIIARITRLQRQGMSAKTGRLLKGVDHLNQSIADILRTRLKKRVMRRQYGSDLFEKIDWMQNAVVRAGVISDIAKALRKWEPRFILKQVRLEASREDQKVGRLPFSLSGIYLGEAIETRVIV